MSDSVQLFFLDDILEIINLEQLSSKQLEISSHEKILDYIELEKRRQDIGEQGEQYVYEQEVSRLKKQEVNMLIKSLANQQVILKMDMTLIHLLKRVKGFTLK